MIEPYQPLCSCSLETVSDGSGWGVCAMSSCGSGGSSDSCGLRSLVEWMLWKCSVCGMRAGMQGDIVAPQTCHSGYASLSISETSSQWLLFAASASFLVIRSTFLRAFLCLNSPYFLIIPVRSWAAVPECTPSLESSSVYIYHWCAQRQTLSGTHCNCPNYSDFICIRRLTSLW